MTNPRDGEIGAVIIEGEATIKYLFFGKDTLTLKPANKTMKKRVVNMDYSSLSVLGAVVAVWRNIKLKRNV